MANNGQDPPGNDNNDNQHPNQPGFVINLPPQRMMMMDVTVIPRFSGTGDGAALEDFLHALEAYLRGNGINAEGNMRWLLGARCLGRARDFALKLNDDSLSSLEETIKAFKAEFKAPVSRRVAEKKFSSCTQEVHESVHEFYQRLRKASDKLRDLTPAHPGVGKQVDDEIWEDRIMDKFLNGIKPELYLIVNPQDPTSLQRAREMALAAEETLFSAADRKRTQGAKEVEVLAIAGTPSAPSFQGPVYFVTPSQGQQQSASNWVYQVAQPAHFLQQDWEGPGTSKQQTTQQLPGLNLSSETMDQLVAAVEARLQAHQPPRFQGQKEGQQQDGNRGQQAAQQEPRGTFSFQPRRQEQTNQPERKRDCYLCGKPGHWMGNCPELVCGLCMEKGHLPKDCPEAPGEEDQQSRPKKLIASGAGKIRQRLLAPKAPAAKPENKINSKNITQTVSSGIYPNDDTALRSTMNMQLLREPTLDQKSDTQDKSQICSKRGSRRQRRRTTEYFASLPFSNHGSWPKKAKLPVINSFSAHTKIKIPARGSALVPVRVRREPGSTLVLQGVDVSGKQNPRPTLTHVDSKGFAKVLFSNSSQVAVAITEGHLRGVSVMDNKVDDSDELEVREIKLHATINCSSCGKSTSTEEKVLGVFPLNDLAESAALKQFPELNSGQHQMIEDEEPAPPAETLQEILMQDLLPEINQGTQDDVQVEDYAGQKQVLATRAPGRPEETKRQHDARLKAEARMGKRQPENQVAQKLGLRTALTPPSQLNTLRRGGGLLKTTLNGHGSYLGPGKHKSGNESPGPRKIATNSPHKN